MVVEMTLLEPQPLAEFVQTPFIQDVVDRALTYVAARYPIHFRGPSGTGKTTLAMHVAAQLGRPVVMMHGDEEFSTSDLVGGEHGYSMRRVIDNFIHSVLKSEEEMVPMWVDNRLTVATRSGFTLVYDEFTRSRPEANNVLLTVLQERLLDLPVPRDGEHYLQVHPDFVAIFTSNPEEYAGVYRTQDALLDRMVTLDLEYFDEATEIAITEAKSGLSRTDSERIVRIVRELRTSGNYDVPPTVRSCVKLSRALAMRGGAVNTPETAFRQLCRDVLVSGCCRGDGVSLAKVEDTVAEIIDRHW